MSKEINKIELLTPHEMNLVDELTIKNSNIDSFELMQRAGLSISDFVMKNYAHVNSVAVLCGTGNNGGDAYIAAEIMRQNGYQVICYALSAPKNGSDAEKAFKNWGGITKDINEILNDEYDLLIDGLLGAGIDRLLSTSLQELIKKLNFKQKIVISIDLPSGVCGRTGAILGEAIKATHTITFFHYKPGHWLYPGRQLCGNHILVEIGIDENEIQKIKPSINVNIPKLWLNKWPKINIFAHKYNKGHVGVFSGPAVMTGASRLAAKAAQRVGAGAVTLLSSKEALSINAQHLTSIMLHLVKNKHDISNLINERKIRSVVLGPGFGDLDKALQYAQLLVKKTKLLGLVLDADALTAFKNKTKILSALGNHGKIPIVITPHEGEFSKLFPDMAQNTKLTRIDKAKHAAKFLNVVVVYKGADTIIASPDGQIAININGTSLLATAGSGDVLSGLIAGLIAQKMPAFEASCASVWLHAACAQQFGLGLIAEDLPEILPKVLTKLLSDKTC